MSNPTPPPTWERLELGRTELGLPKQGDGDHPEATDELDDDIVGVEHAEDLGGVFGHDAHRERLVGAAGNVEALQRGGVDKGEVARTECVEAWSG